MNEIRIPQNIWENIHSHLFNLNGEHVAFLLANEFTLFNKTILLVTDFVLIDDRFIKNEMFSVKVESKALLDVINKSIKSNKTLVEIHNHGDGISGVDFSNTDKDGFNEFVPYILDSLPEKHYAALVTNPSGQFEGKIWNSENKVAPISCVKIIGTNLSKIFTTSKQQNIQTDIQKPEFFSRQIQSFTEEGQKKIHHTKVGIVGIGGLGSHIAQQLAHLGVEHFVLIDPDNIEETNLNRLIGAKYQDIGSKKVDVIAKLISDISGNCVTIKKLYCDLRSKDALISLKDCDVIFGCVDNDGARLILNELAVSYLIHYIDSGTGLFANDDMIKDAGGQIFIVYPNGPCMLCGKMIDINEARIHLTTKHDRENQRKVGYVDGENTQNPSVVSLNGLIASEAVNQFIKLVTHFQKINQCVVYDLLETKSAKLVPRKITANESCLHHIFLGIGDQVHLERYHDKEDKIIG